MYCVMHGLCAMVLKVLLTGGALMPPLFVSNSIFLPEAILRDTLLPKLLSGELSVAGLESRREASQ